MEGVRERGNEAEKSRGESEHHIAEAGNRVTIMGEGSWERRAGRKDTA